jgi:hypothetical protein
MLTVLQQQLYHESQYSRVQLLVNGLLTAYTSAAEAFVPLLAPITATTEAPVAVATRVAVWSIASSDSLIRRSDQADPDQTTPLSGWSDVHYTLLL